MGVYIKGMEMPTDCHNCPLGFGGGCHFGTSADEYMCPDHGRAEWCPLVPVPSHGRLIDADALIDDLKRQCKEVFRIDAVSPDDYWITRDTAYNQRLWQSWCEGFYEYVGSRPTIIPAEEGET